MLIEWDATVKSDFLDKLILNIWEKTLHTHTLYVHAGVYSTYV